MTPKAMAEVEIDPDKHVAILSQTVSFSINLD